PKLELPDPPPPAAPLPDPPPLAPPSAGRAPGRWLPARRLLPAMTAVIDESSSRRSNSSSAGRRSGRIRRPIVSSVRSRPRRTQISDRGSGPHPAHSGHDPLANHRIERQHAPPVSDRGIEILFDLVGEVGLGVDEVDDAHAAGPVERRGLVPHLPG